jgi:hypothetical protein
MSQQQKNKKLPLIAISIGVIAVILVGLYFVQLQNTVSIEPTTLNEDTETTKAIKIAQTYVESSPTFSFDGISDSLDMISVNVLESYPVQYRIEFEFDSAQSGYGNRDGQILAQVITPHKISVLVSDGQVISAVTDETWDELNHQYVLKNPKLPSSDKPVKQFDGKVVDYQTLIAAIESRGLSVEPTEEIEDSAFAVPIKVISVAGMDLQVYEFDSESDADAAKQIVSPDGTEIGLSIIRWMDTPHFYSQGKIIVQYIGQNPEMLNLLDSILGNQFAGM